MPGSAKRFGLDVKGDLELEIRLRRIEAELGKKQNANVDAADLSRARIPVPQVTGLSLKGQTPGSVSVGWNAVPIPDLRQYELQFATNLAFTENLQSPKVAGTSFTFNTASTEGGGGGLTFFARVRARNLIGQVGLYSATLNTTTGQAQTADIADDSITDDKIDEDQVAIGYDGVDDEDLGSRLAISGFINRLTLSNNSGDAAKDVDIDIGVARDTTNVLSISNTSVLTKQLDVAWALGSDAGGLASSESVAADTPYFVFLLSNTAGTVADAGFDTSPTAANLLLDTGTLTLFRRIGCIVTDSGEDILAFHQQGDFFAFDTPIQDITVTTLAAGETLHTLVHVPVGIEFSWFGTVWWDRDAATNWTGDMAFASGRASTITASGTFFSATTRADARVGGNSAVLLLTTAATIRTSQPTSDNSVRLGIMTHGWWDPRGKDGTT